MKCFKIDLNKIPKVILLGKETLIPPRCHYSRTVTEYVLYIVVGGSLKLCVNGSVIMLAAGDVYLFSKGDNQKPVESSFCEYYYVHFQAENVREIDRRCCGRCDNGPVRCVRKTERFCSEIGGTGSGPLQSSEYRKTGTRKDQI